MRLLYSFGIIQFRLDFIPDLFEILLASIMRAPPFSRMRDLVDGSFVAVLLPKLLRQLAQLFMSFAQFLCGLRLVLFWLFQPISHGCKQIKWKVVNCTHAFKFVS